MQTSGTGKKYQALVRQHAELQTAYESKCTQFTVLLDDFSQAK
jgi:hypothetical protein